MPSRRVPRTSGGRFAAHSPAETSRRTASSRRSDDNSKTTANNTNTTTAGEDNGMFQDERPAKKRRLEIRAGPKQQTLDSLGFFNRAAAAAAAQQSPVQPPNKVTIAEPHGQLIETVNGVRTELSTGEEDAFGEEKEGVDTPSKAAPAPPNAAPAAQPVEKRKKEERRSLRSRDEGPRLKSELAAYFGNFEGIMFGAPAEPDFITVDSAIYITDDAQKAAKAETPSPSKTSKQTKGSPNSARVNGKQENSTGQFPPNTNNYNGCQSLDLSTFTKVVSDKAHDPLSEEHFLKSHKRAERKEKQLRNIERERAMHEKVQLDRLLDGLQGHDWLRVLGVTGITDGEARKYEPKRDYFIAEVQALVDKFKEWKDEERRQRLEREAALAAEREAEEDGDDDSASLSSSDLSIEPPSSDLNASAARQLQQETASALKSSTSKQPLHPHNTPSTHPKPQTRTTPLPPPEPIPYRPPSPITSFYSKRHLRDAALGKTRQGRSVTAFGHAVPELEEREFELPPEYVTEEVLKARGREWRRRRREGRGKNDGG